MSLNRRRLRKRIYDKQDLALFDEAIKCYKCKAFRMAYIAIWICIAESLRNKISLMAQKDKIAGDVLREIEICETKHVPADRIILNKTKELGILDDTAFSHLDHMLTMRNIYAHPYNVGPSLQEVELAFIQAIDRVLSIPPLLRKTYIDRLLENLSCSRHFINNLEGKVTLFAQDLTGKIIPTLYPYMLKGLFYYLDQVVTDPDKGIFKNRLIWFTRAFAKQIKNNFSEPEWRLRDKFDDFPLAVALVFSDIDLWSLISEDIQDGILGWLLEPEEIVNGERIVLVTSRENAQQALLLYRSGKLTQGQRERFHEWVAKAGSTDLGFLGIPLEFHAEKLISELSSHNWYIQNPAASCIWNLGPDGMTNTPPDKLELLGRNILQAADGNSRDSITLLKNSVAQGVKWPGQFSKGILLETFVNEKQEYRCKPDYLEDAILFAIRSSQGSPIDLFTDLLQKIADSTPKFGEDVYHGEREAIERINSAIAQLTATELPIYQQLLLNIRQNLVNSPPQ